MERKWEQVLQVGLWQPPCRCPPMLGVEGTEVASRSRSRATWTTDPVLQRVCLFVRGSSKAAP